MLWTTSWSRPTVHRGPSDVMATLLVGDRGTTATVLRCLPHLHGEKEKVGAVLTVWMHKEKLDRLGLLGCGRGRSWAELAYWVLAILTG
jgi:hypothetical protein